MDSLSVLNYNQYYLVQVVTAGTLGLAACVMHWLARDAFQEEKKDYIVCTVVGAVGAILMAYMHLILRLFPQ